MTGGCALPLHGPGVEPGPGPCPLCGTPRCKAKSHRSGERCRHCPVTGSTVCQTHGGLAPQVKRAGVRRVAKDKAQKRVNTLLHNPDAVPVDDPMVELRKLAGTLRDAVHNIGDRVNRLSDLAAMDLHGQEQIRAEAQLWTTLLRELRPALVDLEKLGQDERVLKLAEERAAAEISGWSRLVEAWVWWALQAEGFGGHHGLIGRFGDMWDGLARRENPPDLPAARPAIEVTRADVDDEQEPR